MPIPLGVLAVAGAGAGPVGAGNAYEWLETTVLTGNQASVSFSNLNSTYGSTYQHLQLRIVTRDTFTGGDGSTVLMRFNSDSGSNYAYHQLKGNGSSVTSNGNANQSRIVFEQSSNGNWSADIIDILDPFETTKNTTVRILSGAQTTGFISLVSGFWNNTAALTTILLQTEGFNLAIGSRFSLYGMRSS
jgi:hypothetical protein